MPHTHTHPLHIPPSPTQQIHLLSNASTNFEASPAPLLSCSSPKKPPQKKAERKTRKKFALRLMRSGRRPRLAARRTLVRGRSISFYAYAHTHTHSLTHTCTHSAQYICCLEKLLQRQKITAKQSRAESKLLRKCGLGVYAIFAINCS